MTQTLTIPDYAVIKQRQPAAWSSGDYARIGVTLQIVGETMRVPSTYAEIVVTKA